MDYILSKRMASPAEPGKTVLIADDTAFVRERFVTALEGAGHRAMVARSAVELLARVRADQQEIDLLLVDLKLPHQSGVELVRAVRKLDGGQLPILVFSGTVSSAEEVRSLASLGVSGYINEYSAAQHILPSLAPHLFPDDFNRRGSPRLVLGIPIAYRAGGTVAAALTLNINRGGMAIRTTSPLDRGTEVKLRFRLPGSRKDIDVDARVCWSDARSGMGLAFTRADAVDQTAIDDFVDAHFGNPEPPVADV
jgi:uncharacterized protein (TIGR02266 family)